MPFSVQNNPGLNFTIIVNPDTGPGTTDYPAQDYITAIQLLNTFSNVKTMGYIRLTWAERDINEVLGDLQRYSNWANYSSKGEGLSMHGIFYDEAPHVYTPEAAEYMKKINQAVKKAPGLLANRTVCAERTHLA